jgi:regulatory protein
VPSRSYRQAPAQRRSQERSSDREWDPEQPDPTHELDAPADPESVARLICLRMLTAAPRTRAQLADALKRRGVPDDAAEAVLSRFTDVGLIDDATFAASWVESRHYGRGLGRRALAAELDRRGVARTDIEAAVDQLSAETERATALSLVERKLASTVGQPYQARVRRLIGMLARKGYPAGLAFSVVREVLDRADHASDADLDDGATPFDPDELLGLDAVADDESAQFD